MCFDRASEAATSRKPCWNVVLFQKVWWQHLHSDTLERWCTSSPPATACIISILLMRKAKPPGLNYRSRNRPGWVPAWPGSSVLIWNALMKGLHRKVKLEISWHSEEKERQISLWWIPRWVRPSHWPRHSLTAMTKGDSESLVLLLSVSLPTSGDSKPFGCSLSAPLSDLEGTNQWASAPLRDEWRQG